MITTSCLFVCLFFVLLLNVCFLSYGKLTLYQISHLWSISSLSMWKNINYIVHCSITSNIYLTYNMLERHRLVMVDYYKAGFYIRIWILELGVQNTLKGPHFRTQEWTQASWLRKFLKLGKVYSWTWAHQDLAAGWHHISPTSVIHTLDLDLNVNSFDPNLWSLDQ